MLNKILAYLIERQKGEIQSGMVTNAIIARIGKTLGKGMKLDHQLKRENNEKTNVNQKRQMMMR